MDAIEREILMQARTRLATRKASTVNWAICSSAASIAAACPSTKSAVYAACLRLCNRVCYALGGQSYAAWVAHQLGVRHTSLDREKLRESRIAWLTYMLEDC